MTLLIVYLLIALIISFICSIMEAVLLSTPISFLTVKSNYGHKYADRMIKMKSFIDRPLSAILSLNTVAHTVGAAGVGAQAVKVFGEVYFGVVSAVLTILILIFTEIIPKTIGATFWRTLAPITSQTIRLMIIIAYPLVILSSVITKLISKNKVDQSTSREEIAALAHIGTEEGVFAEKENKIIQNLIRLRNIKVTDVMTPRVVVTTANEKMGLNDFLKIKDFIKFSRIPVFDENDDQITGYVFRQKVFEQLAENRTDLVLRDIKRNITIVPNTQSLIRVWETLLERKEHIALVVDEYGGMDGIVTMEDVIETLLGFEIVDEKDTITDMQQYARERWIMRQEKYRQLEELQNKPKA
ncbi:MAG: hemolysin family protein [Bacteroidales bacterium]